MGVGLQVDGAKKRERWRREREWPTLNGASQVTYKAEDVVQTRSLRPEVEVEGRAGKSTERKERERWQWEQVTFVCEVPYVFKKRVTGTSKAEGCRV